ncbi:MAG TPA: hypothetical protein VNX67_01145 [Solirubrobacteraceae bacterium]|jgi:hypothetical protein|nr:hypothetical protein [Solirubrobacteraceae bacterium]
MRFGGLLVGLMLLAGLAGTAVALHSRESNTQFVSSQQALAPVGAVRLDRLIVTTSDPRPGYSGRARGADCKRGTHGALGNPWTCAVRYPRLPRVRYRVSVYADGSVFGSGQPEGQPLHGVLTIKGCCVASGVAP